MSRSVAAIWAERSLRADLYWAKYSSHFPGGGYLLGIERREVLLNDAILKKNSISYLLLFVVLILSVCAKSRAKIQLFFDIRKFICSLARDRG